MPTRPSDEYSIRFYLAAPDCAEYYRPEWLDEADRIRLLHHPARAAQTGWRVSRFLKRRAGVFSDGLFNLSHSGGHAVLAVPSAGFAVGVDLERLRERRFDAWPDWVLHEDEARWLQRHSELSDRYALWTLKEALIKAHDKAVAAMGQRWGQDSLVSFIELGSVGHWGEWHVNYEKGLKRLPSEDILERYVAPWRTAFPKTQILMRRPFKWGQTYQLGLYNDMVGEALNTSQWLDWIRRGGVYDQTQNKSLLAMPQAWKTAAIGGEMTSAHSMEDLMGSRLQEVLKHVKASHMTFIGPKAPKADLGQAAYQQILSQLGYQIYVSQAQLEQKRQEQTMTLTFENRGAAPFYYDWPLYLYLQDGQGKELKKIEVPLTLSQLVPGRQEKVSVALNLSSQESSQAGHYQYSLGIVDPMTGKDALRLAMPGYDAQVGRTILFPTQ